MTEEKAIVKEGEKRTVSRQEQDRQKKDAQASAMNALASMDIHKFTGILERLQALLDMLRGVRDYRTKLSPILEPEGVSIETTARLTSHEAFSSAEMFTLDGLYKSEGFFHPLAELATHRNLSSVSIGGGGREDAIRLMGAISGTDALRGLGINLSPQMGTGYATEKERKKAEKSGRIL